jgi:hypothetical protein
MPDQHIAAATDRERSDVERHIDNCVLALMFREESWPWNVAEFAREIGETNETLDSIRRLTSHGLAPRHGDFVFPTRPARRAREIEIGTA